MMTRFARATTNLLLLGTLVGCSDTTPSVEGTNGPLTAQPPQTLRVVSDEDIPTADPHLHHTVAGSVVLHNVFEPLVKTDAEGAFRAALAERWESGDSQHWRFFLRSGVQFHDGTLLTTADVTASLERAMNNPRSEVAGFLAQVNTLGDDPVTGRIDISLNRPDPNFLYNLAWVPIVQAKAPEEIQQPVGTGPYRWVSHEPGGTTYLEAFEGHWNGAPAVNKVEFLVVTDPAAAVQMLEEGTVDLQRNLPPALVAQLEGNPDLWVESRLSQSVLYLELNPQIPPLDDPRIRQAVDLAVDRQVLMHEVCFDHARPASQILAPGIFGFDPELVPVARDLETARSLIREAGFTEAPPRLVLETTGAFQLHAQTIAGQLAAAGFQVEVSTRPWPELYSDLDAGRIGVWFGQWIFDSPDAGVFFELVTHSPTDDGLGTENFSKHQDPTLDRLIREAVGSGDSAVRRAQFQAISRQVNAHRIQVPLLWPLDLYGSRRDVEWIPRWDGLIDVAAIASKP